MFTMFSSTNPSLINLIFKSRRVMKQFYHHFTQLSMMKHIAPISANYKYSSDLYLVLKSEVSNFVHVLMLSFFLIAAREKERWLSN